MPTTILLVDDHPVFRKGLRQLLEEEQDFKVVGEAGDGKEAIALVGKLSPDVVVMDINMPNFNGIEATREIVSDFPETKIVALSIHSGKRFIEDMLRAGAVGYILKECAPEELINGIKAVIRGEIYLSPSVTGIVVSEFVKAETGLQVSGDYDMWTAGEMTSIIHTKLYRPLIPKNHVHRSRLLEQLEKGRRKQLTLVSAPAGYGKSILLSCWLENCDCPNAWYSADESDNNLRQFLIYFLTAFQTMFPDAVEKTLALANSGNLPPMKALLANLINEMNLVDQDYILVIDDIHLIQEKQVYDLLTELLRYPPQRMHLVLIGRRDPFLPISSFRAQGLMTEIRLQDLCFISAETKAFLEQVLGEQIQDAIAAKWTEKTEGWIAGLHLGALSMRQRGDATSILTEIPSGLPYATEYLFDEIFKYQPPEIRRYLMSTSVLNRFCAPLCDALLADEEKLDKHGISGQEFINWLRENNLFIIPLDTENKWFRYHHLFQSLLQNQLEQGTSADERTVLHRRASDWLESRSLFTDSIAQALAGGDVVHAAAIVERHRDDLFSEDRWHVVERWLAMLPATIKQERPVLLLTEAWIRNLKHQLARVPVLLDQAESLLRSQTAMPTTSAEIAFFRGYIVYFEGQAERSLQYLENSVSQLAGTKSPFLGEAELMLGLARCMVGQKKTAIQTLEARIGEVEPSANYLLSRLIAGLAFIYQLWGELPRTRVEAQRLLRVSKAHKMGLAEAWSYYFLGWSHLHADELEAALFHFAKAVDRRYVLEPRAAVDALAGLALTQQLMRLDDEAAESCRRLQEFASELQEHNFLSVAQSCQARLSVLRGDVNLAVEWGRSFSELPAEAEVFSWLEAPSITQARVLIADGTRQSLLKAAELLRTTRDLCEARRFKCQIVEVAVLQSMALEKLRRSDEALTALEEAVSLAEPAGWVRPFVELGSPMAELLKRLLRQKVHTEFVEKLLAAFSDKQTGPSLPTSPSPHPQVPPSTLPQPLVEPLTNRELDILELLARRLQNKEIAEELFISKETVKTHLNNIYQKLNVTNRLNAVEKAKSMGIL